MSDSFNQFRKEVSKGLQSNRWSLKSLVAIVLFGAIIVVFVLFGFPTQQPGAPTSGSAAVVNKTLIPLSDLRSEASRLEQMYAPMFGGNFAEAQRQFITQQALETLINTELVFQIAGRAGILSTDHEIQEIITKEITPFQKEGRFQKDLYFGLLEANRLTPQDFEQKIRKERVGMRAQRLFEAAAKPSNLEIEKLKSLREQKLNIFYAKLDKDLITSKSMPTKADAEKKLADAAFAAQVQEYFNANKPEFNIDAQVRAEHILIKTGPTRNEAEALKEIQRIAGLAKTGDFGKLASQFSEDEGSKVSQGDLGFFSAGKMVPEFEKAAFSQNVGEVGEPVKTQFGYHLIRVTDKKEAGQRAFEQVRVEIAQKLIVNQAYDADVKALEEALTQRDQNAVDKVVKKMGATWSETGSFDLSMDQVPGLNSAEATKAAFTLNNEQKLFPQLIRDGAQRFVLKLKDFQKQPVAQVDEIRQQVTRERAMEDFKNWVESHKKTAKIERNIAPQNM